MPDPIDELENFSLPGPPMNPLPAAEVRRRGNRIRRRNNALATVGALAVVAAIAAPVAVVAGSGDDTDTIQPAPTPGRLTTIPADFDLGAVPDGVEITFDVQDRSVVDQIRLCGAEGYSTAPATDTAGATWSETGSSGFEARTLALYPTDDEAASALDGLRQAVLDCPRDERGERPTLVNEALDVPVPGAEDALVYTNQVDEGGLLSDLTALEVVRVGNSLYIATSSGTAGGPQAEANVTNLVANSAPVVSQLCVFSAAGCADAGPTEAVEEPPGLTGAIPDGFPLEKGLPTDQEDGAVGLEGPSRDLALGVYNVANSLQACGVTPTGLPEPVDTLYAGFRGPAEGILRQLMTFSSVQDAEAYVDNLIDPFAGCPEDADARGVSKLYEVTHPELGDATAVSTMRSEVAGEPGIGYQVLAATRVGQAVLVTLVNNDGDPFDAARAASYVENTQTVVDEMS